MTDHVYPDKVTRRLLTAALMTATVMTTLDSTIANVALPHMQGSVSASQDEITWVLTSYIVASAIVIPLCGWLAKRYGRKRLMIVSVAGFTLTSALCGLASGLGELVLFRLLQGVFAAALVPMSQAILLDINPPEKHPSAMAVWTMGAIIGPIVGPVLGGWLTDSFTWRWVFYVNVPVGALALFGFVTFLSETRVDARAKLDLTGFFLLAMAIGLFQMMLDRGQQQDWFSSTEICLETAFSAFFFYAFVVHTLTVDKPFIDIAIFKDRNFLVAACVGFLFGVLLYSVLALLPTMLQQLMGYPVVLTGLVVGPRGFGTMASTLLVGPLMRWLDARILVFLGFVCVASSLYSMAGFSLGMGPQLVLVSGLVGGLGTGFIFVPLSTMAFATLNTRYRNEGAAMYTLIRSLGSAVGISVLQTINVRNTAIVHARLTEAIRPDNPVLALRLPGFDFQLPAAVAALDAEITRQAGMVGYLDGYWMLFVLTSCISPLILLLKPARRRAKVEPVALHME